MARTRLESVRRPGTSLAPPAITSSAAPATGSTATMPGNGVLGVIRTQAVASTAAPTSAIVSRLSRVSRRTNVGGTSATMAPTPSSQARVSVEKYADVGDATVAWIDQSIETRVSATSIV